MGATKKMREKEPDDWLVDQERERLTDQEKMQRVVVDLVLSTELGSSIDDVVDLMDWARASKN